MTSVNVEPIISDVAIPQGSPEWFAARMGKITASKLSDLIEENKIWGVNI